MGVPQVDSQNPIDPPQPPSPLAGGSPDQGERSPRQDLANLARELEGFRQRMMSDAAPGRPAVQEWVRQTRGRLAPLLGPNGPAELREPAAQLDLWLQHLPAMVPAWEAIRAHRAQVQALRDAIAALGDRRAGLREQITALAALAPAAAVVDLKTALAAIPPRTSIEPVRQRLANLVRETQATLQDARERAERVRTEPIVCPPPADTPLGRQIQAEARAAASAARRARRAAAAFLGEIKPLVGKAELESQAAERLDHWRRYLDLMAGGRALEARVGQLGAAGIHAFFIKDTSGVSGPFQLDEAFMFGTTRAALRSTARNGVRLIEVPTVRLLGRSDTGTLVVPRPGGRNGGADEPVTFRVTERWDDLVGRFEFLLRETAQALARLAAPPPACSGWCGQALAVLADPHVMRRIRDEHQAAADRWRRLLHDLQALAPVKARIGMWNLVGRLLNVVPRIRQRLSEVLDKLNAAEQELAGLIARCPRDAASGQILIPPALSATVGTAKSRRDRAAGQAGKLGGLLTQLGAQLDRQLAGRPSIGTARIPAFQILPDFPPELSAQIGVMSDAQLATNLSALQSALHAPVQGQSWEVGRDDEQSAGDIGLSPDQWGWGEDSCSPSTFSGS